LGSKLAQRILAVHTCVTTIYSKIQPSFLSLLSHWFVAC